MYAQFLTSTTATLPLARMLALVALLCAGALQVQEANHGHWDLADDGHSQCLLCQSTADTSVPVAVAQHSCPGPTDQPAESIRLNSSACCGASFLARGPPSHS